MKSFFSVTQIFGLGIIVFGLFEPRIFFQNYLILGMVLLVAGGFGYRYYLKKEKELNELVQCPYCAENIKEEAVICKHCGKKVQEYIEEEFEEEI